MKPVLYASSLHGKFQNQDCYIVLKTELNQEGNFVYDLHYWIGKSSQQDKSTAAAIRVVQLSDMLPGYAKYLFIFIRPYSDSHITEKFKSMNQPYSSPTSIMKSTTWRVEYRRDFVMYVLFACPTERQRLKKSSMNPVCMQSPEQGKASK